MTTSRLTSHLSAAPRAVSGLRVASSSSHSLLVSWQMSRHRVERIQVLLTDLDRVLVKNVTLGRSITSVVLEHLQPGTWYIVTVATESVGLQSSASTQAATGTAS